MDVLSNFSKWFYRTERYEWEVRKDETITSGDDSIDMKMRIILYEEKPFSSSLSLTACTPFFFAPLAKKTELESFIIYLTDVYVRRHQQFQHWQQVTICMTKKPSRFSSGIFHLPPLLVVDSFFCSSSGPCQLKWQPIHENTEHGENIHIVHTLPMSLINDESI